MAGKQIKALAVGEARARVLGAFLADPLRQDADAAALIDAAPELIGTGVVTGSLAAWLEATYLERAAGGLVLNSDGSDVASFWTAGSDFGDDDEEEEDAVMVDAASADGTSASSGRSSAVDVEMPDVGVVAPPTAEAASTHRCPDAAAAAAADARRRSSPRPSPPVAAPWPRRRRPRRGGSCARGKSPAKAARRRRRRRHSGRDERGGCGGRGAAGRRAGPTRQRRRRRRRSTGAWMRRPELIGGGSGGRTARRRARSRQAMSSARSQPRGAECAHVPSATRERRLSGGRTERRGSESARVGTGGSMEERRSAAGAGVAFWETRARAPTERGTPRVCARVYGSSRPARKMGYDECSG